MLVLFTRSKMEILKKLKAEFLKLDKRGRALVVIGACAAIFFLLELLK